MQKIPTLKTNRIYPHAFLLDVDITDTKKAINDIQRIGLMVDDYLKSQWKVTDYFKGGKKLYCYNDAVYENVPELSSFLHMYHNQEIPNHQLSELSQKHAIQEEENSEYIRYHTTHNGVLLNSVPKYLRTENVCIAAVKANLSNINFVPEKHITDRLIRSMLEIDGHSISLINSELLNDSHYLMAIKKDGEAIEFFPAHLLTEKNCEDAVRNNGLALRFVPYDLRTKKVCNEAISSTGFALSYVPDLLKTEEMCTKAFNTTMSPDKMNYLLLKDIPAKYPNIIKDYAEHFSSFGCAAPDVYSTIREDAFTDKIVQGGLALDGSVFNVIPKKYQTKEYACQAVRSSGLNCIDRKFIDTDLIMAHLVGGNSFISLKDLKLTPEHYLYISKIKEGGLIIGENHEARVNPNIKHIWALNVPIDELISGKNIFNMDRTFKEKYGIDLPYQIAKDLYNGQTLKIPYVDALHAVYRDAQFSFNNDTFDINVKYREKIDKSASMNKKKSIKI